MSYVGFLKTQKKKTLVVLDLNGILVLRLHQNKIPETTNPEIVESSKKVKGNFHIWRRPHLDSFLEFLFQHFEVAVWTSAMSHNMQPILDIVFENLPHLRERLVFQWGQEQCKAIPIPNMKVSSDSLMTAVHDEKCKNKWQEKLFLKTLSRICEEFPEYTERSVLFIDDSPEKMVENPHFSFFVPTSFTIQSVDKPDNSLSLDGEIQKFLRKFHQSSSTTTIADFCN